MNKIAEEIDDVIENELLASLTRDMYISEIESDEVTAPMLARSLGVNAQTAKRLLEARVASGELTIRKAKLSNGNYVSAYKKVI